MLQGYNIIHFHDSYGWLACCKVTMEKHITKIISSFILKWQHTQLKLYSISYLSTFQTIYEII